jgi:signal transduction histidine kinase
MSKSRYRTLYQRAHFLHQLGQDLDRLSLQLAAPRVARFVLRRLGEALGGDVAVHIDRRRQDGALLVPYRLPLTPDGEAALRRNPDGSGSDLTGPRFLEVCGAFLAKQIAPADRCLLLLPVESGDRTVGLLGFYRFRRQFSRDDTRFGQESVALLSLTLERRERERAQSVREKISMKIFSELRPKDVLYQMLHGLKRIFQYDHSAAILFLSPDRSTLTVQAEIIAWAKAKSNRIGQQLPVAEEGRLWLERPSPPILLRGGRPDPDGPQPPESLTRPLLLEAPGGPPGESMILAEIWRKSQVLGVLQIIGLGRDTFTPDDLQRLREFLPLASSTMYNSELYAQQYDRLVTAERKVRLADLARAISHDLNNAFGVILPLLQTLQRDIARGRVTGEQIARDLEVIEHYAASSARIFQGLLSMGRGKSEPFEWCNLNSLLETTSEMIARNLEECGIRIERELDPRLPTVCVRRGEMEQLFLNLMYNARDAMAGGGRLRIRSRVEGKGAAIEFADTGHGIPEEIREKIFEPFFTTKETGSGLGLDICRSIAWEYGGTLDLRSSAGEGTTAKIWLPRCTERTPEEVRRIGELGSTSPALIAQEGKDGS